MTTTALETLRRGEPSAEPPRAAPAGLLGSLRDGVVPDEALAGLWRSLPPVRPEELRGLWRGWAATREHRTRRMLDRSDWYGKLFVSDDDVAPLVCRTADGALAENAELARGGASLRLIEHDDILTTAMVYDGMPVIDLFVRLTPDAVLGVMTGPGTLDDGVPFHFVLERNSRDKAMRVRRSDRQNRP